MKKNISINISGIIFHIEEDGYESLRKYLDSINKYFASFEDSSEILADIESRIAELFLSKLNEGKQVITAEDVNSLITTMGSVNDFKAAEEPEFSEQNQSKSSSERKSGNEKSYSPPKHLFRDKKRKILGGVCSGLGSYLNVDPVWIRLLFALLTFAYGITFVAYFIMWIAVPGSEELDEPEISKKMFRDTDRKVLGGVAGGVAAYLGVDIVAVRFLFIILSIAGGLGLLIYLVLWVVLPEARTLTDKMQMQGEPVTLSNIESTIKKNQNIGGNEDETPLTKILLFPFRLLALMLTTLAKIIVPLVDVLRVGSGILIMLLGLALILAVVISGGVMLGMFTGLAFPTWWGADMNEIGFPVEIFKSTFPALTTLAAFTVALVPSLLIMLLGVSAIAKRIVFGAAAGWTLFILFFASVVVLGVSIPRIIYSFKESGEYKIEKTYELTGKTAVLKLKQTGLDDYDVTNLTLKGYEGKEFKLVQVFEAQGSTKPNAIENARMIEYNVDVVDSTFTFDSNIQFKKDAKFRAQHLNMTLYIPYDFPFVMGADVCHFISTYIDYGSQDSFTWKMTPKGLECITCAKEDKVVEQDVDKESDLTDFNEIDINGVVDVNIRRGDNYSVDMIGSEKTKQHYKVYRNGNTLIIDYKNEDKSFWKQLNLSEMRIDITLPHLQKLDLKGAGKVSFEDFSTDNVDIDILGAMTVKGELHSQNVTIHISGASTLSLKGKANTMEATVQGASNLKAYDFEVRNADVEVNGASNAKVNVTGTLEIDESLASHVDYHGHPNVSKND